MTFRDDLAGRVAEFAGDQWEGIPDAYVVPSAEDVTFGNDGKRIDATILYADISGSTQLVDELVDSGAAEYYKAFLHCASQLVKRNGGEIQAYDGDRVMAVFIGEAQADKAVSMALELNFAVEYIINPIFKYVYSQSKRTLKFTVGIDTGKCLVVKVGVRTVGELAWIGGAANYAAKLNSFDGLEHDYPIRITKQTFDKLQYVSLYGSRNEVIWDGPYNNLKARTHYRTNYYRNFD
jgi:class 3 adenylate cyclase